jgi:hypothetical protein
VHFNNTVQCASRRNSLKHLSVVVQCVFLLAGSTLPGRLGLTSRGLFHEIVRSSTCPRSITDSLGLCSITAAWAYSTRETHVSRTPAYSLFAAPTHSKSIYTITRTVDIAQKQRFIWRYWFVISRPHANESLGRAPNVPADQATVRPSPRRARSRGYCGRCVHGSPMTHYCKSSECSSIQVNFCSYCSWKSQV